MTGFIEFISNNFLHVLPILIAALYATVIILERIRALYFSLPMKGEQKFFDQISEYVMHNRIGNAVAICDRMEKKPLARVVKQGLLRAHQPENLMVNGLELAVAEETQRIQKRTGFLAMIANVATLLGLLGTILGLIAAFQSLGDLDVQQRAAMLAKGISTAMNATMLGLGVAIPCMVAFSFLMNTANQVASSVETGAVRIVDIIKQKHFAAERTAMGGDLPPSGGPQVSGNGSRVA
jgi:biopolymer transport protein ExbB